MKKNIPAASKHLSKEAKALWRAVLLDFDLDAAALAVLGHSLEALDRMREAQRLLAEDGLCVLDRFGAKKLHPAAAVERDSRSAVLRGIGALGLDLEPIREAAGRPARGE